VNKQQREHVTFLLNRRARTLLGAADKALLRDFLNKPFRIYKVPDAAFGLERFSDQEKRAAVIRDARERLIWKQKDALEEALFALYRIPNDWPELQWKQLALHLAGEHFKGCRILRKPVGGPSDETVQQNNRRKLLLFLQFRTFIVRQRIKRSQATDRGLAEEFFRKHKNRCVRAGFNAWRSFYKAMNEIRQVQRNQRKTSNAEKISDLDEVQHWVRQKLGSRRLPRRIAPCG
jgi:hypothetical protein